MVQPAWDPNAIESLPWARRVDLPRNLDPATGAVRSDATTALAAADVAGTLWLMASNNAWFHIPYPEATRETPYRSTAIALSDDGSRIVVAGRTGLWWRDVATAGWTKLRYPRGLSPADYSVSLEFGDTDTVVLGNFEKFWALSLPTGAFQRLRFDRYDDVTALPGGDLVASRFAETPLSRTIERHRDGMLIQSTDALPLESLQRPVASGDSIVMTRADTGWHVPRTSTDHDGLLALRLDGLTTRAFLPVVDRHGWYSDAAGLTAIGWLGEHTVLATVRPRNDAARSWLITWDVASGELSRVGRHKAETTLAFAIDAL